MSGYEAYALWDLIRRATCNLCGVKYVRQITDAEKANRIADTICQTIYDLGKAEREADTPQTKDYDFRDEQEYNDRWNTDCPWK